MKKFYKYNVLILLILSFSLLVKEKIAKGEKNTNKAQTISQVNNESERGVTQTKQENFFTYNSFTQRIKSSDWVVFATLLLLIFLSISCWGVCIGKLLYLSYVKKKSEEFVYHFWQTNSLKNLANSITKYPYSPAREIFKETYKEFQRNHSLQKKELSLDIILAVSINSLTRSIQKSQITQRKKLEKYLPLLAITASTAPFIGLFGTVWGIMNAFQSIALSGNASLTSVAPGLSEALIATAFGLGAAIPSVIGYSLASNKIRTLFSHLEGFSLDFVNIIEKHLILTNKNIEGSNNTTDMKV